MSNGQIAGGGAIYGIKAISPYQRHIHMEILATAQGATAPVLTTVGTMRGLAFDADAEVVNFVFHIPFDWDGASDMALKVHWTPESGDVLTNNETVKWDCTYRSITEGDAIDNGTQVVATATHTQSGGGTDKEHIITDIPIDFDHTDQPLTAGDCIVVQFDRDFAGDSYTGDGVVFHLELAFNSNALPTQ